MKQKLKFFMTIQVVVILLVSSCSDRPKEANEEATKPTGSVVDPLGSWNDGTSKKAIIDFVTKVTKEGSADFIPVADRVACFDNDGTLWSEQPLYFQFIYAFDRVKELAPQHPEWKTKEPFSSVLKGDMKGVLAGGEKAIFQLVAATQTGMTSQEFESQVKSWIQTAKHPKTNRLYTEMIYQPMLELLEYLRANDFKTYIVSGGEVEFMRAWAEGIYGIPPEQVIGSTMKTAYEVKDGKPQINRLPEFDFIDDKDGKPLAINEHIGKRPVFTAGNSDGDYAMLQWTSTATGYPRFGMIVHHTDSVREWAYDRHSPIGHLEKGLDDASKYGWLVVNMKEDWKEVFAK